MKFSAPLEDIIVTGSADFSGASSVDFSGVPVTGSADVRQITGDGVTSSFTILHNLGSTTPAVHVFDDAAAAEIGSPRPSGITANSYTLVFAVAPAVGVTFTVRTQG